MQTAIQSLLEKGRKAMPIGTVRVWGGQKYIKHMDGWVAVGGKHHGKMIGKFKDTPTHKEHADKHTAKPEEQTKEQKAEELGRLAFHAGKQLVPAHDPYLLKLLESHEVGTSETILNAWNKGWQSENLKAPIDLPKESAESKEESPREKAEKETKRTKEDYENARESKFSNLGVDIKESARHKALRWKGLADAEASGLAEKMVKRDFLLKQDPPDFFALSNPNNVLNPVIGYLTLKKFPALPPRPRKTSVETLDEDTKLARKQYVEAFEQIKSKALEVASNQTLDPFDAVTQIRKEVGGIIETLRKEDRFSAVGNGLVSYHNNVLGRGAKGVKREANTFLAKAREKFGAAEEQNILEILKQPEVQEAAKRVLEGKTIGAAFGEAVEKRERYSRAELYTSSASREGPKTRLTSKKKQEKFLLGICKMRGVQWGNSVTDGEREYHLRYVAESFNDLAEILQLPQEMASFNGRLGIAIGARGKQRALAHYEPTQKVINLTRKGGIGSLAHEWGHFFDNILPTVHDRSAGGFTSEDMSGSYSYIKNPSPIEQAMKNLFSSEVMETFQDQIRNELRELWNKGVSVKRDYWLSSKEIFARTFETYIDYKLNKSGRSNTYLAGAPSNKMWPSKFQIEKMTPHFDKIFEEFKNSKYLNKALTLLTKMKLKKALAAPYYVGLAVVDPSRTKLLLAKRTEDQKWTGPGGGGYPGEYPDESAIREAFEEANLKLKVGDLIPLPPNYVNDGRVVHCYLVVLKSQPDLGVQHDPDKEVKKWQWFPLDKPLPDMDENRARTIVNAKMKLEGLIKSLKLKLIKKAIAHSEVSGIDINTAEHSMDEMATKPSPWVDILRESLKDFEIGDVPREVPLSEYWLLTASQEDDGIYSGYVKNNDPNSGDSGQVVFEVKKMTLPQMVQALKAKEYIADPKPATPVAISLEMSKDDEIRRLRFMLRDASELLVSDTQNLVSRMLSFLSSRKNED